MRGVVSLASALAIPLLLTNGQVFPHRSLILFITFVVILITLVFQGLTLPLIIKWVKIKDTGDYLPDEEQEAGISLRLMNIAVKELDEKYADEIRNNPFVGCLRDQLQNDKAIMEQRLASLECDGMKREEVEHYNRILLHIYKLQRRELHVLRTENFYSDEEIRKQESQLDLDEAKLIKAEH